MSGSPKALGRYELLCELSQSYLGSLWAVRVGSGEGQGLDATVRCIIPGQAADQVVFDRLCEAAWTAMEIVSDRVPTVVDVVLQGNEIGIVADYCEGLWLRALSRQATLKHVVFPVPIALRVGVDLLEALAGVHAYAETLGEVGPDLFGGVAPDSVLVGTDGRAHLTDVLVAGVAATLAEFSNHPERTPYLAPEQVRGAPVDQRTDLFSAGVMLWEALAGRRLFFGIGGSVRQKILSQKIQALDEIERPGPVSPALSQVIARALERDPDRRFKHAREMIEALTAAGGSIAEPREVADFLEQVGEHELNRLRRGLERAVRSPRLSTKFRSLRPKTDRPDEAPVSIPVDAVKVPAGPSALLPFASQPAEARAAPPSPAPAAPEPQPSAPKPAAPEPEPRPAPPSPAKAGRRPGSQPDIGEPSAWARKAATRPGSEPDLRRNAATGAKALEGPEAKPGRRAAGVLPDLSRALQNLAVLESTEEPLPSWSPAPLEEVSPPPPPVAPIETKVEPVVAPVETKVEPAVAQPVAAPPLPPTSADSAPIIAEVSAWPLAPEPAEDEPTTLWLPRSEQKQEQKREPARPAAVVVSTKVEPVGRERAEPQADQNEPRQRAKTILGLAPPRDEVEPRATLPGAPAPPPGNAAPPPVPQRAVPPAPSARRVEPAGRRSTLLGVAPMAPVHTAQPEPQPPPPPRRPEPSAPSLPEPAPASPPPPASEPPIHSVAPVSLREAEERANIASLLEDELRAKPPPAETGAGVIAHTTLPSGAPPLIHDPRLAEMAAGVRPAPAAKRSRGVMFAVVLGAVAIAALALLWVRLRPPRDALPSLAPSEAAPASALVTSAPSEQPTTAPSVAEAPAPSVATTAPSAPSAPSAAAAPEPPPRAVRAAPQPGPRARPKRRKNYVPDDI